MSYGVYIRNSNGDVVVNSPEMTSLFFDSVGTYSSSQSLSSGDPSTVESFYTQSPEQPYTVNPRTSYEMDFGLSGFVDSINNEYYAPGNWLVSTNLQEITESTNMDIIVINKPAEVFSFKSVDSSSGYGFVSSGSSGTSAVNSSYQPFYVEPDSSGQFLRTATVGSVPYLHDYRSYGKPQDYAFVGGNTNYFAFTDFGTTINFERDYNNPPLIFIKSSSKYITFNGYIKNSSGKYTGAKLICAQATGEIDFELDPNDSTDTTFFSVFFYQSSSVEYFIVSNDPPVSSSSNDTGINIFNSDGDVIYNTDYLVSTFDETYIEFPYCTSSSYPVNQEGGYRSINFRETVLDVNDNSLGVLINNLTPINTRIRGSSPEFAQGLNKVQRWFGDTFCGSFVKGDTSDKIRVSGVPNFCMVTNSDLGATWFTEQYFNPNITQLPVITAKYTYY